MISIMGLEDDIYHEGINMCDERWECKITNMYAHLQWCGRKGSAVSI